MSRRKLAALAGVLPLGALAVGTVYAGTRQDTDTAPASSGPATSATAAGAVGAATTIPTQTAPAAVLAPEIAKIGGRHIAALHAIHDFLSHISTYEPQSLDTYFAGAINSTTGPYRQQLIDTQNATRQYYLATNSRSHVVEFNAGLRAVHGTTALAVGYVKQATANDRTAEVTLTAAVVTAEEQPDGRWLVSDLKRIST
ncbi:hypothetical protein [Nocardia sp. NPDC048505]|uniref:hypothetical protein n=1 Tax=unclassified Nocardia TaxID=2637762 RepID=UPI0033D08AFA